METSAILLNHFDLVLSGKYMITYISPESCIQLAKEHASKSSTWRKRFIEKFYHLNKLIMDKRD